MSVNSKGSGETALTAGRLCDKYPFLMCWLKITNCMRNNSVIFLFDNTQFGVGGFYCLCHCHFPFS